MSFLENDMKHLIIVAAVAAALTGFANAATRDQLNIQDATVLQSGLSAQQSVSGGAAVKRWTDTYTQINHRGDKLDALQTRLDKLGERKDNYFGAKAQCWINAGQEEFALHDNWGFVEEAIGEASRLTAGLETGKGLTLENPPLRTVSVVRPDLWARLNKMSTDPRFAHCPQAQVQSACAEVELMHAGHEAWTRAFDKAQKRVDSLQTQLSQADQALSSCTVLVPPAPVRTPLPEVISLSVNTLFAFNRGDVAGIKPEGRRQLEDIATKLQGTDLVKELEVFGYTDRLGSSAYNLRLSQQRANSVKQYLQSEGLKIPIASEGRGNGKANPGTDCDMRHQETLIHCLQPDRRVEIRLVVRK
jgi:OOP family OmpA-OmpF porin